VHVDLVEAGMGQAPIVAGLELLLGNVWVFPLLVPALLVVRYGITAREERYLERRFGDEYRPSARATPTT
jgi:protein-S-isoprenylcysteine O-methyltransferase Ste14